MDVDDDTDGEDREWIVTATVTLHGATAIVRAASEEEAREKVRLLDMDDGFDTSAAELVDWSVTDASLND